MHIIQLLGCLQLLVKHVVVNGTSKGPGADNFSLIPALSISQTVQRVYYVFNESNARLLEFLKKHGETTKHL